MESAMVPSFFIFTPLLYSYHIGYGKWHGTPVKPNTLPQLKVYPCLGSVYTKDFSHGGGTFPNTSKLFFGKMENFFSIRKCIRNKRRRTHLGPRLAKIFLRPFSDSRTFRQFEVLISNIDKLLHHVEPNRLQPPEITASFLHEDFIRSSFQKNIFPRSYASCSIT